MHAHTIRAQQLLLAQILQSQPSTSFPIYHDTSQTHRKEKVEQEEAVLDAFDARLHDDESQYLKPLCFIELKFKRTRCSIIWNTRHEFE